MPRFTEKSYQVRVTVAMMLYVAVLLLVWPSARSATQPVLKVVLALLPTLPVLYTIWQMARRVWLSDELQQRTHLIALGAATAVVGVASLIGGFLAAAGVVPLDGSVLMWVFPVLLIVYYSVQRWVSRHYGDNSACDEDGIPRRWGLLLLVALCVVVGWVAWRRQDAFDLGLLLGLAASLAMLALARGVVRWRQRRARGGL